MSDIAHEVPTRRDFLTLLAGGMAAVGGAGALWPLVDSLNPAKGEEENTFIDVDLSKLAEGRAFYAIYLGKPVLIARRTAEQIAGIDHAPERQARRNYISRRPLPVHPVDPPYIRERLRSIRNDVLVFYGWCTFDYCLLLSWEGARSAYALPITATRLTKTKAMSDSFQCPCCGTFYDLAGRAAYGPGTNLSVPPHWFSDANTLVVGQAPPDPRYPDGGA